MKKLFLIVFMSFFSMTSFANEFNDHNSEPMSTQEIDFSAFEIEETEVNIRLEDNGGTLVLDKKQKTETTAEIETKQETNS